MRRIFPAIGLGLAISAPAVSFAQPAETPPPPPGAAPPPPPPPAAQPAEPAAPLPGQPPESIDRSIRRHDGFYLRIGLGLGGLVMTRSGELSGSGTAGEYKGDSQVRGGGGAFELSIGGTVGSGVVICGTLFGQSVRNPKLEPDSGSDVELGSDLSFGLIGPGLHWYPDPTGGFHFGGTLGLAYAVAKTPDGALFDHIGGAGGGLSLAAGYDFWISDQWSLGIMVRLTGAGLHGEATQGNVTGKEDDRVSAFALMFTVLYH